jgi:membrane fusion protein (multidrug efflux system)
MTYDFVGRTQSSQRVEIRPRVDGFLDEILFDEGEFVEEGDPMFQIDPAPFEARLRAANAELAQQQARLDNAQALLDRVRPLAEADAVAQKDLDDAVGGVREASAAVEAASAGVFDAELNLGYTLISAPVRGLTSSSAQREGSYISPFAGPLTYVAKIDPIWVEFSVSETQILRVDESVASGELIEPEAGAFDVTIVFADGSTHPQTGRISFTDASVSTATGTFLVRAEIPNPAETVRPGQYVRVVVSGAYRPDAITVPKRAMFQGQRGAYVWVVDSKDQAEQRPVEPGRWIGERWAVDSGLQPGDRVVVNGTVGLRPGTPLMISKVVSGDDLMGASAEGARP